MMKSVNINTIRKYKRENKQITALTAYDYSTAKYIDESGVDIILVGDSLAMVALGYDSTHHVGMDEMVIFTKAVAKGVQRAFVVTDMPFMSYHISKEKAVENAGNLLKIGAKAVKIEGCSDYILDIVSHLTASGVPVMGHIGFTPQFIHTIGGYNIQGKSVEKTIQLMEQAKKLQEAGVFSVVLEMVPEESAKYITDNLEIPTIAIGAGRFCSGQILVIDDILGKYADLTPRFAKKYADLKTIIKEAVSNYVKDVEMKVFPTAKEVFSLTDEEVEKLDNHAKRNN